MLPIKISKVKINILANYASSGWSVLMSLLFVPLYIKFMGIEAYGLIGFFASLQTILYLLDMGLSVTFQREIARLSAFPDTAQTMRNLLRTFEMVYWGIAFLVGIAFLLLAPVFATHWLKPGNLPNTIIQISIMLMGVGFVLRWPGAVYAGGLSGQQRLVLSNILNIVFSTLRGAGAVLLLWLVSPTIIAFFIWQAVINLLQTLTYSFYLDKTLPQAPDKIVFDISHLQNMWKFAAGVTGITFFSTILTQMDKILLSKLLSLEYFGYYVLAGTVASSMYALLGPVAGAVFPRFSQLIAAKNELALKGLYHATCQMIAIVILPAGLVICFFSSEILFLWTHNQSIAQHAHILLSVLIIGSALNGLMVMPYQLQIAYGWTRLVFIFNLCAVIVLVPMIIILAKHFGAVGAAWAWVLLNMSYVIIIVQIMHRKLLIGEEWKWYWNDFARPLASTIVIVFLARRILPQTESKLIMAIFVTGTYLVSACCSIASVPFFWNSWRYSLNKLLTAH